MHTDTLLFSNNQTQIMEFVVKEDKLTLIDNGKVVAWIEYEKNDPNYIHLISTISVERGKGYASKLVEKALEFGKKFNKIKVSCPYIKSSIEKKRIKGNFEFTKLLELKEAIDKFNYFREPEAKAELISFNENEAIVKFSGPFCVTCGIYDYFEDILSDFDGEIVEYWQEDYEFFVKYRAKGKLY